MGILSTILQLYTFVLIAYVIASYVPRPPDALVPVFRGVRAVVDPVLQPLRARIPPLRVGGVGFDIAILILFFVVQLLATVLASRGL